ncbi:MAG TPA: APC family permease [Longimicrobiales bacterium]|nr:APC family permease [Longimicrobiales bacterium]
MASDNAPQLRRALGLLDAVGIGFGAIVGAGIFVVTGVAAGAAGPALIVALGIAGAAATANALSSAQLAAVYPYAGGSYEYGYRLLGGWAGYIAGWMFLASKTAAAGTVAIGLGGYLGALVPDLPPRAAGVAAIVLFTVLNLFGVKRTSAANLAIVAASVGALLVFVLFAANDATGASFEPFAPTGIGGIMRAAALLFFAYTGYARIATLGEEVHHPERTIPRAVMITIVGAILLYAAVAAVAIGTAGAPALARTAAPLYVAASSTSHAWLPALVAVGGLAAMLGVVLSQILGLSRMGFAMARRDDLPAMLSRVDERGVPRTAVIVVGTVAAIVAATGALDAVAAAASFTILVYYGITNAAAIRLRNPERWLPAWVPVFGVLACATLALSLDLRTIIVGLVVLAAGVVVRVVQRR